VLQNQVLMIARMDQNLVRLGATMSPDLQKALGSINTLLRAGDGIALRLATTQSGYDQLFPKQASAALTHDDAVRNAKARWDEQYAAFQRAALLQGQIADGIETDTGLLATAMGRSRDAVGALEAVQAGNELTALNVKQALALQGLLAAQYRAETTRRARDLAAEEDARQRFKTFLGTGSAYTASRY
jgi:P-type conjugative transfer protein TrbJ